MTSRHIGSQIGGVLLQCWISLLVQRDYTNLEFAPMTMIPSLGQLRNAAYTAYACVRMRHRKMTRKNFNVNKPWLYGVCFDLNHAWVRVLGLVQNRLSVGCLDGIW
jgi:hypothetical protein